MLTGHHVGWPVARGGSQAIADALASIARSLGGEIECGHRVERIDELDDARAVLFDLTPRQVLAIAGERLPAALPPRAAALPLRARRLQARLGARRADPVDGAGVRAGRHRAPRRHVRGDRGQRGGAAAPRERPYVLLSQPTVCDPSRAPEGKHVGWAYCHVPSGSTRDMTDAIEAPDRALRARLPRPRARPRVDERRATMEAYNANYVGGDINGGLMDLRQLFTRPVAAARAVLDARPAAVHLLVRDPARGRGPRHVRLLGGSGGAEARRSPSRTRRPAGRSRRTRSRCCPPARCRGSCRRSWSCRPGWW